MNCTSMRSVFSALFEDQLESQALARAREHLAGCAVCSADYESFRAATLALRSSSDAPTSAAYVASVLAAVAAEPAAAVPPLSWLRWATHLAALAAGALLMLLASPGEHDREASSSGAEERLATLPRELPAERGFLLELAQGSGSLEREGSIRSLAPQEVVALLPGDVLRARRVDALELVVAADGRLLLATPGFTAPTPQIVERSVERPVEVLPQLPAADPTAAAVARQVERGLSLLEGGLEALQALLARAGREPRLELRPREDVGGAATLAEVGARPPAQVDGPSREPSAAPAERGLEAPRGVAAVRIRRDGERLRLETHGPPAEVVPALLVQLQSSDPEVVELVHRRLEAIRAELPDPDPLTPLDARAGAAPEGRSPSLASLLFGDRKSEPVAERVDRLEEWSRWWAVHASQVGGDGAERVF